MKGIFVNIYIFITFARLSIEFIHIIHVKPPTYQDQSDAGTVRFYPEQ